MSQSSRLIQALKRELKAQDKTYADVAVVLALSEASVKRLFSDGNLSLKRLEAICELAGLELAELVRRAALHEPRLTELSHEQEQQIASDMPLLLVAVSVVHGLSYEEILQLYQIEQPLLIQKLARLDRLKLIELLPGNRIKLRVAPNFNWRPNGPIQRFFFDKVQEDFFRSRFDKRSEKLLVLNGILSDHSNAELQKKMQRLADEFNGLLLEDQSTPLDNKAGNTLVLALRQWQYSLFKQYRK
ncbi:XRE family transcriptional regulator [Marinobacterium arenosum]|uniref:XRE family transcriptional regulator n=1 Tax=Marinobacterium arenosum TaxID=2862496 RepID=UPI001C9617CE|nr:XRE family transcriptional regulator [Marinobacterium arenosum]MBY4678934.1 XRE family transcriptional regulator [Marinobacterium arenosum]